MEYSQAELVRGIRNKDSAAYEYMICKYTKTVFCLAYNILSESHSKEDIEECVADVFLDAWIKIAEFDEEKANFRTWLLILTKYKALTYRRKKRLSNILDIEDADIKNDVNLEKLVLLRQDQEQVIKIINSFQKIDREIFVRRFFLGEKISDLAKAFNLSRAAVDNRLLRGRKIIKEGLQYE
ncbi:RNA polymerase sigma factor, sigma-70 family [Desulfoscipio gibsoniae DSM 7213]|uniref:RNA polymerase sigma factor, sigma-70 family n=1 Tax=Desulfoscipio gibsoniae DSM 7213 TaxID=767817 RepID=R4KB38_9FIRM|nr:RNA polymerase sigma factor, sigma-70 family [Desulfoscipio gibsoniae DSM 7213]